MEWAVVVVGIVLISVVWGDSSAGEVAVAAAFGGVIYLLFGAFMAKLGYARKTLPELRAQAEQRAAAARSAAGGGAKAAAPRARPAPTKRTASGPSQHPRKKKR